MSSHAGMEAACRAYHAKILREKTVSSQILLPQYFSPIRCRRTSHISRCRRRRCILHFHHSFYMCLYHNTENRNPLRGRKCTSGIRRRHPIYLSRPDSASSASYQTGICVTLPACRSRKSRSRWQQEPQLQFSICAFSFFFPLYQTGTVKFYSPIFL